MTRWLLGGLVAGALVAPACTRHTVKLEPIEIKPIHITMDINIKVQERIKDDFDFMDQGAQPGAKEKPEGKK